MGCDEKSNDDVEAPNETETYVLNLPRPLNIEEKKYLLAVERGDLANVTRFIQSARKGGINGKPIDINCVDSLGRGGLTLAIEAENFEMVELLVVMGVETKDALLHAIDQEFVETVELLLEHEELVAANASTEQDPRKITYSWQKVDPASARYPREITPLILAAQRNNYEILKLLLDRGATLPSPHDIRCGCEECIRFSNDPLSLSSTRISEYKALASPSLIALSSPDPLQTAFQLSWELRDLTIAEPESRTEYLKLRRQIEKFAVDLLQQVRTTMELKTILNYEPNEESNLNQKQLARLELAIQYKQKQFVAHSHVQQLLAAMWYDGLPGFRRMTTCQRVGTLAKTALLFPYYCIVYYLAPESQTGRHLRKPFVKFLVHATSYMFFLFILVLVSQRAEDEIVRFFGSVQMRRDLETELLRQRGTAPTILECIVVVYVLGFIWQEMREAYVDGLKAYLRDMWNFIDFTRNFLYIATFVLRVAAYFQQKSEIRANSTASFVPREAWSDYDPQLISEGLFAAANICSALKLIHLFSINPQLGPLQISLGRMVIDIVKFLIIYSLVLFSFACGLNQLLWYFAELEKRKCYAGFTEPTWDAASDACLRWRRFSNVFESCQSLFWASFGGIGIESFELNGIKSYTRFWGLLMFGSYCVINVIVLLNLLIAMMSNSYAVIETRADTEWKFARTKLWMSYFEEGGTLPPPFNIIPAPKMLLRMCGLRKKTNSGQGAERKQAHEIYGTVMRALVWRYVVNAHSEHEMEPVTEDDIHELKTDLSSWRCELLDILHRNGMDICGAEIKEKTVLGKKMRMWERQLMKDFQVAGPVVGMDLESATQEELSLQQPEHGENPAARWRRVAKLAVMKSANHRWDQVVRSAVKYSQIGQSNSIASMQRQLSLKKAMEEAQRLAEEVVLPPVTNVQLPETSSSTILHVLQEIVESDETVENNPSGPNKIATKRPDSLNTKSTTLVDYVDEKPNKTALDRTPTQVKNKSGNETPAIDSTRATNNAKTQSKASHDVTDTTLATDDGSVKSRKSKDKETLVNNPPKSPCVSNNKPPRRPGPWL